MNSHMEFITGKDAGLRTVAVVPNAAPVGITVGMVIEINHREYGVLRIIPIISRANIDYQIHVEEVK